ncbi:hypothetical protein PM082_014167 [Marasmius tenuissimus]|nr:hypothetical protein PM082_014167 [Marasmius tenuissimus]
MAPRARPDVRSLRYIITILVPPNSSQFRRIPSVIIRKPGSLYSDGEHFNVNAHIVADSLHLCDVDERHSDPNADEDIRALLCNGGATPFGNRPFGVRTANSIAQEE